MGNTGGKIKEGGAEFIGVFKPKSNRKKKQQQGTTIKAVSKNPIKVEDEMHVRRGSSVEYNRTSSRGGDKNITFYMPRQLAQKQTKVAKQNNEFFETVLKNRDLPMGQRKSRSFSR